MILFGIIFSVLFMPVLAILFFSWRRYRRDVVEKENYFKNYYK